MYTNHISTAQTGIDWDEILQYTSNALFLVMEYHTLSTGVGYYVVKLGFYVNLNPYLTSCFCQSSN